jgi:ribosomal protein L29
MKANTLREHTDEELKNLYEDTCKQVSQLKVNKTIGEAAEQPLAIRTKRRDIARIMTILSERAGAAADEKGKQNV